MSTQSLIVSPTMSSGVVKAADGNLMKVPKDWELLPPGDAGLTRRVKAAGPSWTVHILKGRKKFSQGVWAPAENILAAKQSLETERATEAYAKRKVADANRRDRKQNDYVDEFRDSVIEFLAFDPRHESIAMKLATAVAIHATPVGSGTVARTQRIPVEQRAEAAVIAWLRHQTTAYDHMRIARAKGERRGVRRELAAKSRSLLEWYRLGAIVDPATCPLRRALEQENNSVER